MPVFPLANCVLLPHGTVTLHIFEKRYQTMVRDALDTAGNIAMATLENANLRQQGQLIPTLRPMVCVGQIIRYHKLDNGRYNIMLQGIARAQIVEERSPHPAGYRTCLLERLEVRDVPELDMETVREQIEKYLNDPLLASLAHVEQVRNLLNQEIPTCALVDFAATMLCHNVEDRYAVLAEPHALSRARWFLRFLREIVFCLRIADQQGAGVSPSGLPLN